jgi:hypothetical protein
MEDLAGSCRSSACLSVPKWHVFEQNSTWVQRWGLGKMAESNAARYYQMLSVFVSHQRTEIHPVVQECFSWVVKVFIKRSEWNQMNTLVPLDQSGFQGSQELAPISVLNLICRIVDASRSSQMVIQWHAFCYFIKLLNVINEFFLLCKSFLEEHWELKYNQCISLY